MNLKEVQMAAGMMQWLSSGFTIGKADVANFICFRTGLERIQSARGGPPSSIRGKAPPAVVASIAFWLVEFAAWDCLCPIVAGFSPVCSWEILGRQDAGTDWGCGGFFLSNGVLLGYAHPWNVDERRRAFVAVRESTGVFELMGACHWMHCTPLEVAAKVAGSSSSLTAAPVSSALTLLTPNARRRFFLFNSSAALAPHTASRSVSVTSPIPSILSQTI
jgi:hypothetical protein